MFKRAMTIVISALAVLFIVLLLQRLPQGQPGDLSVIQLSSQEKTSNPSGALPVGEGAVTDGVIDIRHKDAKTGQLVYTIRAQVLPEARTGRANIQKPRISFFSKKGSQVSITAPQGWIQSGDPAYARADAIESGKLDHGVVIRDDRGTEDESDDLTVIMNECYYEQSRDDGVPTHRFHTDVPVVVRSPEVEIHALGLNMHLYKDEDQDKNKIKRVELLRDVQVTMYQGGDKLKLDMAPGESTDAAPADASSPGSSGAAAKETAASRQKKTPYRFMLHGDVVVRQGEKGLDVRGSQADVELVAWMSNTFNDVKGGSGQASPGAASSPAASSAKPVRSRPVDPSGKPVEPTVITCRGPLIYMPVLRAQAPADFHLRARGERVVLRDRGAWAEGDHLEFDAAAGAGQLTDKDRQVAAELRNGDVKITSEAMDIVASKTERGVGFSGTGSLVANVSSASIAGSRKKSEPKGPVKATWSKKMRVFFDKYDVKDASGRPKLNRDGTPRRDDYVHRAVFEGDAALWQGESGLSGHRVVLDLFAPRPKADEPLALRSETGQEEESLNQGLKRLEAVGNVAARMPPGSAKTIGSLTCGLLALDFEQDQAGKSRMKRLLAQQKVDAVSDQDYVRAENLQGLFRPDTARPENDAMAEMIADGNVVLRQMKLDKKSQEQIALYAEGEHLKFRSHPSQERGPDGKPLPDKSEMHLEGKPDRLARASRGSHMILGQFIDMNEVEDWARVRGPGELRLLSNRGADGKKLEQPMPLNIFWTDSMSMDLDQAARADDLLPKKYKAHFQGQVRTRVPNSAIDCDDLWAFFTVLPKGVETAKPADKKPAEDSLFGTDKVEATRVAAAGHVVVQTTDVPKDLKQSATVTTIWGPTLEYQFDTESAAIDGAGRMYIAEMDRGQLALPTQNRKLLSTTTVDWKRTMVFNIGGQDDPHGYFDEGVVVTVVGQPKQLAKVGDLKTSGKSTLTCQRLWLNLRKLDNQQDPLARGNIGLKDMIASRSALQPVEFRDGENAGQGDRVSFDKVTGWLTLSGQPARIETRSEKTPQKFEGAILRYSQTTGQVEIKQPWTLETRIENTPSLKK
jgi:hypothetical protein